MERLLQYLDDIDDLVGVVGLSLESLRRIALKFLALAAGGLALAGGFLLALSYPSHALGIGLLLLAVLAYRALGAAPQGKLRSA